MTALPSASLFRLTAALAADAYRALGVRLILLFVFML